MAMEHENLAKNFSNAEGSVDLFLHFNAASEEAANELLTRIHPDNGDPDAERLRRGMSGGHYLIAEYNKGEKTYLAVKAHVFPGSTKDHRGIQWQVSFAQPYLVKELPDSPGHFTAALDGKSVIHLREAPDLDKARAILGEKLLKDGLITSELASEIGKITKYHEKFTTASCSDSHWLELGEGSPELVRRLESSFSPPNGDPRAEHGFWQKTVGWVLPATKNKPEPVAIKVENAYESSAIVDFMRPLIATRVPGGRLAPQFGNATNHDPLLFRGLRTQGNASDLRESMAQVLEKLTKEGFIDQTLAEEITQKHEKYLQKDLEARKKQAQQAPGDHLTRQETRRVDTRGSHNRRW